MAFSLGDSNGGFGRRGRFRGSSTLAEINIVPLVDVVLVLLIIFMLTAHVVEYGLEINGPKVTPTTSITRDRPVVSMQREGGKYINGNAVNLNLLGDEL